MRKSREENPELARVLSRVNALMKHGETALNTTDDPGNAPSDEAPGLDTVSEDAQIPVLTDVYEGEPLNFPATETSPVEEQAIQNANMEAILAELLPLIRAEVKKAVRQELVNTEKIVNHRLETELIQTLLERLRSDTD